MICQPAVRVAWISICFHVSPCPRHSESKLSSSSPADNSIEGVILCAPAIMRHNLCHVVPIAKKKTVVRLWIFRFSMKTAQSNSGLLEVNFSRSIPRSDNDTSPRKIEKATVRDPRESVRNLLETARLRR